MAARTKSILLAFLTLSLFQLTCRRESDSDFVSVKSPLVALTHVRVIDGSGAPAREDQTILIESGRIKAIGDAAGISVPADAKVLDLKDRTAIPGLVGMHEHLFYTTDEGKRDVLAEQAFSRLYLASGITTIRTAGAMSLEDDKLTRKRIDRGEWPGPEIHLSSPYINHIGDASSEKVSSLINDWADQGVTSLKVYEKITRGELATVIRAAHSRGLKVTGHLCAVGFREAVALGIDNLEHGLLVDTEFYSRKTPDNCAERNVVLPELLKLDIKGPAVQQLIKELVEKRVAITSTLAIFETFTGNQFQLDPRMQQVLTSNAYQACLSQIAHDQKDPRWAVWWQPLLKKEMEFEREFVRRGGILLAGVDPTGWGGVVAGFGDQRQLELLLQAGFSAEEAIRIYSLNGAEFLGQAKRIGTLEVGKQADIVILLGNPAGNISHIRKVELVFKNGVGYDAEKLIASIAGTVG